MNEEYNCEFCDKQMTEEDHDFCDICGDCREENEQ
jgi:rRNA maturation endonuclease Nob1